MESWSSAFTVTPPEIVDARDALCVWQDAEAWGIDAFLWKKLVWDDKAENERNVGTTRKRRARREVRELPSHPDARKYIVDVAYDALDDYFMDDLTWQDVAGLKAVSLSPQSIAGT